MSEKQAKKKRQTEREQAEKKAKEPRKPGMRIVDVDVTERADLGMDLVKLITDLPSPDPEQPHGVVSFTMTMALKTGGKYVKEHLGVTLHKKSPKQLKLEAEKRASRIVKPKGPIPGLQM